MLDIGGDIGAMTVLLDSSAVGTELFLRAAADGRVVHTGVWSRHIGGRDVAAAVFCELEEGEYSVLAPDGTDRRIVEIVGGRVTELDLRSVGSITGRRHARRAEASRPREPGSS